MKLARKSWFGCSVAAGLALAGWAFAAQVADNSLAGGTALEPPSPLQVELHALEVSLSQWIDDKDTIARSRSLVSATELGRMLEQGEVPAGKADADGARSMLASLQAGLQALSIQDRLIHLAEREVRRAKTPESVERLVRANQRREEIILIMIEPAISLFGGAVGGARLQPAEAGWFPPLTGDSGI